MTDPDDGMTDEEAEQAFMDALADRRRLPSHLRGALSCVAHVMTGHELHLGANDRWYWHTNYVDMEELRRMLDTGEDIKSLPTDLQIIDCTEDELRAMEYVNKHGVPE